MPKKIYKKLDLVNQLGASGNTDGQAMHTHFTGSDAPKHTGGADQENSTSAQKNPIWKKHVKPWEETKFKSLDYDKDFPILGQARNNTRQDSTSDASYAEVVARSVDKGHKSDISKPVDKPDRLTESKQAFERATQEFNKTYNMREEYQKAFEVADNLSTQACADWEHFTPDPKDKNAVFHKLNAYGRYIGQLEVTIEYGKQLLGYAETYIKCHEEYVECHEKYVEFHNSTPQLDNNQTFNNILPEFQGNHSRWPRHRQALNGNRDNLESTLENFEHINNSIGLEEKQDALRNGQQDLLEQRQKLHDKSTF